MSIKSDLKQAIVDSLPVFAIVLGVFVTGALVVGLGALLAAIAAATHPAVSFVILGLLAAAGIIGANFYCIRKWR